MKTLRIVLIAVLVGLITVPFAAQSARAANYFPITGTGSTWSQNALDQWRSNVARNYAMTINYNGIGSTSGRRDFIDGTVDFAISEIPFQPNPEDGSAPEKPKQGYAYMPIVAGGTSFMYHLKINGKRVTNLRLSGETIVKIFTGAITNWNDEAIKADNPGLAMPDKTIVPVIRADGSGTSAQFTLWMSKQHPKLWTRGMTSQYPNFGNAKAQKGSDGVAGYVAQNYGEGAITYVEYSYAKKAGFPVAKVLNEAGYYIEPTANSVAVALLKAKINNDKNSSDYLTQILDDVYNNTDKRSYPLSSYSYAIVPTEVAGIFNEDKGNTLGAFMRYVLCEGQQQADTLGYSPLPMNLVMAGSEQIKLIPGAGNKGIDTNSCNNPTFRKGDSPSKNQLASSAPNPAECDKKGPTQCATGTAGAKEETPVKNDPGGNQGGTKNGTGNGTNSGNGTGSGNNTDSGQNGDPVNSGGLPGYDENGDLLSSSDGGGGVPGSATASPFTLPDQGMGAPQWLMVGSAVLLVGAVVVPPLVSKRLKASGGRV